MCFKKQILFLMVFTFSAFNVHAQETRKNLPLTAQEVQRVRAVKAILFEVDDRSLTQTLIELGRTKHPRTNLEMKEAIAKAYADIVRDYKVDQLEKKRWLYSKVCLNMAYLQFGGGTGSHGAASSLDNLIRQELKKYLPSDVLHQPGFLYSL